MSEHIRLVIPDSHGLFIDARAAETLLSDVKRLAPKEIVWLGDHIDVSGLYNAHPPSYVEELEYSYEADLAAAEAFMDAVQRRAPKATGYYLEGNHEQHVERLIARTHANPRDARAQLDLQSPAKRLRLKDRGFKYCRMGEFHHGLSVPGTIRLGKCHFVHGFTASKFATAQHVERFAGNVVHGHTHRAQSHLTRTLTSGAIGGWCPGTLAQLQPLWRHTAPSNWTHGYAIQVVSSSGRFLHINVPIVKGWSGLPALLKAA